MATLARWSALRAVTDAVKGCKHSMRIACKVGYRFRLTVWIFERTFGSKWLLVLRKN